MSNEKMINRVKAFAKEMQESGECRTVVVRYTDEAIEVILVCSDNERKTRFEWEDKK